MDARQVYDVHAVDRRELSAVVPLEYLLRQVDHLLHRNVEAAADSFEEDVGDVEVDDEYVPVEGGLDLQIFIFGEEGQEEVPQLLDDRLEINLLLVKDGLVDSLFDEGLALCELVEELADQRTHLLILHVLF